MGGTPIAKRRRRRDGRRCGGQGGSGVDHRASVGALLGLVPGRPAVARVMVDRTSIHS
jgi:hypothetical protein